MCVIFVSIVNRPYFIYFMTVIMLRGFGLAVEQWLTRECGIDLKFCAKNVLFGVVEKDNFINSVICYARLYIMKCKIQDKQIAIEGFLNLIENEGVLYPI